ncbi:MAG TPA: hypothetical protein VGF95_02675 [Solirubrobacteraceae bacterium]|jgi:uncharacterized membrane protein
MSADQATSAAPMSAAPMSAPRAGRSRSARLLGLFFTLAGVNHFVSPGFYRKIVPPGFGDPAAIVAVSGVAEIVGGLGALAPRTRRPAGLWIVALLAAVFPANLYMALAPERFKSIPRWALYARLPLQPLMMWWAWRATRRNAAMFDPRDPA